MIVDSFKLTYTNAPVELHTWTRHGNNHNYQLSVSGEKSPQKHWLLSKFCGKWKLIFVTTSIKILESRTDFQKIPPTFDINCKKNIYMYIQSFKNNFRKKYRSALILINFWWTRMKNDICTGAVVIKLIINLRLRPKKANWLTLCIRSQYQPINMSELWVKFSNLCPRYNF